MTKPEYIIWIFTTKCNLNCLHCYTYRFKGLGEPSLSEKLRVVSDIGETGVDYVDIAGGEPLIHPHFPHLVKTHSEYGVEESVVANAAVDSRRRGRPAPQD
jgi:Predicted Fe-S oxidoreductases